MAWSWWSLGEPERELVRAKDDVREPASFLTWARTPALGPRGEG